MRYLIRDWSLVDVEKSKRQGKKYDAIITNGDILKRIPFGATGYEQYHDKIGLYSRDDHHDPKRRTSYRKRHASNYDEKYYSPAYFSWNYLW